MKTRTKKAPPTSRKKVVEFTTYFAFSTEGGRIGLVSCKLCGAAIIVGDPDFGSAIAHQKWHSLPIKKK